MLPGWALDLIIVAALIGAAAFELLFLVALAELVWRRWRR